MLYYVEVDSCIEEMLIIVLVIRFQAILYLEIKDIKASIECSCKDIVLATEIILIGNCYADVSVKADKGTDIDICCSANDAICEFICSAIVSAVICIALEDICSTY